MNILTKRVMVLLLEFGAQKTPVPEDFLVLNYLENGVNTLLWRQNLYFMGI